MTDTSAIINAERLTTVLQGWPAFHDAEVLSVRLDRRGPSGPTLGMEIWVFSGPTYADFPEGYPSVDVSLRFGEIDNVELLDFGPQNVLACLVLERGEDRWTVSLSTSYGLCGSFTAESVEVVAVTPHADED